MTTEYRQQRRARTGSYPAIHAQLNLTSHEQVGLAIHTWCCKKYDADSCSLHEFLLFTLGSSSAGGQKKSLSSNQKGFLNALGGGGGGPPRRKPPQQHQQHQMQDPMGMRPPLPPGQYGGPDYSPQNNSHIKLHNPYAAVIGKTPTRESLAQSGITDPMQQQQIRFTGILSCRVTVSMIAHPSKMLKYRRFKYVAPIPAQLQLAKDLLQIATKLAQIDNLPCKPHAHPAACVQREDRNESVRGKGWWTCVVRSFDGVRLGMALAVALQGVWSTWARVEACRRTHDTVDTQRRGASTCAAPTACCRYWAYCSGV